MHIYISGIGGAGLGPLAEIAQDAGYRVSGSDVKPSLFSRELERRDIDVIYEQTAANIAAEHLTDPIDWLVATSALPENHPELVFAREHGIKISKRAEFLNKFLQDHNLKLIAVAGTHGKTTATGLLIWACQQLGWPVSYSIGSTLSFGPSGRYDPNSKYFIYEADEYDRNFLEFSPQIALLPSVDYDHNDIYPTRADYRAAFAQFVQQSEFSVMFEQTEKYLEPLKADYEAFAHTTPPSEIQLAGQLRRDNAFLAKQVLKRITEVDETRLNQILAAFPGVSRRFEKLADHLYSDYAHHPTEIAATMAMARELNPNLVVVYEPHQNQRQLEIIDQYQKVFTGVKQLYWLPTFSPPGDREKADKFLCPADFIKTLKNVPTQPAEMNDQLWQNIADHRAAGDLVLAMSAGDLDEWLRSKLA
jgi:UDP-N-acetylmuramate--alanine ligase